MHPQQVLFAFVALLAGCGPRFDHVAERTLPTSPLAASPTCGGYLVWNHEPVRDVFLVVNGSGVLSNAFVHPTFEDVLADHPAAYATFDKPGIHAPFGDPAAVTRDPQQLEPYTLGHGVTCAIESLRWAREQFGPSARLHVRGHSEGSLIALYAYDQLLRDDPALARGIETLVLSGLALEPFGEILARQLATLPDGEELQRALEACDWEVLMARLGISCAYVEDASARPSGRTVFERFATHMSVARFYVFHGTNDWNTPVAPVRDLEAWNTREGHLRLQFHYYEGGHTGSDEARAEVSRLLDTIVSER
jgi:hypothetical protein